MDGTPTLIQKEVGEVQLGRKIMAMPAHQKKHRNVVPFCCWEASIVVAEDQPLSGIHGASQSHPACAQFCLHGMVLFTCSMTAASLRGQELRLEQPPLPSANSATKFIIAAVPQLDLPHPSEQKPFLRQKHGPASRPGSNEKPPSHQKSRVVARGVLYA